MAIRRKHVRTLVDRLLHDYSIKGPEVPVNDIATELGVEIRYDTVAEGLSGFLVRHSDSGKAVIGVNASHPKARQRFTIAHELGHYLLHEGELVHFDGERPGYRVNLRQDSAPSSDMEREANLFAAELLMPARFLEKDERISSLDLLGGTTALQDVAKDYGVSVQALTFRLANLNLIEAP